MAELRPEDVAARLAKLRALYVPESIEEARERLERERPERQETFDQAVARRLRELRAVCDLVNYVRGVAAGPPDRG
jgi:hypothetical protein